MHTVVCQYYTCSGHLALIGCIFFYIPVQLISEHKRFLTKCLFQLLVRHCGMLYALTVVQIH